MIFYFFCASVLLYNLVVTIYTRKETTKSVEEFYTEKYIANVSNYITNKKYSTGGILLKPEIYNSNYISADYSNLSYYLPYSSKIDYMYLYNLNDFDKAYNSTNSFSNSTNREEIRLGMFAKEFSVRNKESIPFERYILKAKIKNRNQIDSLRIEFIKSQKIQFIFLQEGAVLPNVLEPMVDVIFTDSLTNENCIFLKETLFK